MSKNRFEAFSDGVIAIILTIMVLELKIPKGDDISVLNPLLPVLLSYILSFLHIGIYWSNHHHMLHLVSKVNGKILWANLYLLFWLSLLPFVTGWMGENYFAAMPVALYGVVLLMSAIAYFILAKSFVALNGRDSKLAKALGNDFKGKISVVIYIIAIALTFINSWVGFGFYASVAVMWIIPDRRVERIVEK